MATNGLSHHAHPDEADHFFSLMVEVYTVLETAIPARLDRLPWSPWHWRVVIALGVSWLLDGLEVTVVGSLGPALQRPDTLGLTAGEIGCARSPAWNSERKIGSDDAAATCDVAATGVTLR